jgi:aldehyde dehydrogenase (NAD+)
MLMPSWIAGEPLQDGPRLAVHYPWDGSLTGETIMATAADTERAITTALRGGPRLTRHDRSAILLRAADLLDARTEAHATLIRLETGLCQTDCRAEAARAGTILRCAAMECLREEGSVWPGDVTPAGFSRKLCTIREPVQLALAITPFNHPLTQCAHKTAPAIAAGAPLLLKPSEKTPLIAMKFAELLYEAGLPGWMLSCFTAPIDPVIHQLLRDPRIDAISFTGGTDAGRQIAAAAGLRKTCLELGGNAEFIVLPDADLALAARLGADGSYRNSGQRCTAIKRFLVHKSVAREFTDLLATETLRAFPAGDPASPATRVGTVITEAAAISLGEFVNDATSRGAHLVCGGQRHGALIEPTVLANVPRSALLLHREAFGPLSPIVTINDTADAIALCNDSPYGLATAVMTNSLHDAFAIIHGVRTGMVQVNEVPAWRLEHTPFGGIKESGPGTKEGVTEAIRFFSHTKSFSLPWPTQS